MELLSEYGLFLLKTITVLIAVIIAISALAKSSSNQEETGHLVVTDISGELNKQSKDVSESIENMEPTKKSFLMIVLDKSLNKIKRRKNDKTEINTSEVKQEKKTVNRKEEDKEQTKNTVVILEFKGDVKAKQATGLSKEITAILAMPEPPAKVLIKLTSPGGLVYAYGFASSQIARLKDQGIYVSCCVDTVAASGGYMMAVVADEIIAAPFAVLGSIGVVAQIPNINRFLKNYDVDIELHTAGAHKRTLTVLGENTPEGRRKLKEDLEQTHVLFKNWIIAGRPDLDIEAVADGSVFYGADAINKGLIDRISTSDDIILELAKTYKLVGFRWHEKKSFVSRFGRDLSEIVSEKLNNLLAQNAQDFKQL